MSALICSPTVAAVSVVLDHAESVRSICDLCAPLMKLHNMLVILSGLQLTLKQSRKTKHNYKDRDRLSTVGCCAARHDQDRT